MYGHEDERDSNQLNQDKAGIAQRAVMQLFNEMKHVNEDARGRDASPEGNEVVGAEEGKAQENADEDCDSDVGTEIGDIEQSSSIYVSAYQIYNENINDLLGESTSRNLLIRLDQ